MRFNVLALGLTMIAGYVLPVGASVLNSRFFQQRVIDYVIDCMGDEIYDVSFISGRRTRTRFHPCTREARDKIMPQADVSNLKTWVKHYVLHGELKVDTIERMRVLKARFPVYANIDIRLGTQYTSNKLCMQRTHAMGRPQCSPQGGKDSI